MKKLQILAFIFVFTAQNVCAAGYERVLTEDSSVQTAIAINHDILLYSQNLELAKQRIKEAQSLYLPKIDLNLNVSTFNTAEPMILLGEITPSPVYFPAEHKNIFYSTRLSIWQSVYSGGRVKTTNKLAEINLNKVKNEENIVKSRVINKVKIAFNDCLYYKEKLKYYNSQLEKISKKQIKASSGEVEQYSRKIDMAEYCYDRDLLNLLSAIGLELNTIADVSGEFKPIIKNFDLNQCLLLAYQFKPEMQTTQYQETIDGLMVNLLSMQRFPTISVGAGQEWLGDRVIGDESSWYISLNANIPIFDGGSAFARVRQARINVREATLKRSKTEEAIRLEVNKAFLEYNFWKKQANQIKILERDGKYTETDLDIISNLNKSYYALELAVGVQLDTY